VGLTLAAAAALIFCTRGAWDDWEGGQRRMHPAFWELWCAKAVRAEIKAERLSAADLQQFRNGPGGPIQVFKP
jgi:hypothetical protein